MDKAKRVLKELSERGMTDQDRDAMETVVDFDADETTCPACGHAFPPAGVSACPDCGLSFG